MYFQRGITVLKVTWNDMVDKDARSEFNPKVKSIVQGMIKIQDAIVEAMKIDQLRVDRDPALPQDWVPTELRYMSDSQERDLRDWIFLREAKGFLEIIQQIFGFSVVEHR